MGNTYSNSDIDFLKRFDKPAPRYTNYPTATVLKSYYNNIDMFKTDLLENNKNNFNPISIYIHIPFCETLCYFCGCITTIAGVNLFEFGMSSISHLGNVCSQNYYDSLNKDEFPIALGYRMTIDYIIRKYVIMKLMCDFEFDKREIEQRFKIDFDQFFQESKINLEEFKEYKIAYENDF